MFLLVWTDAIKARSVGCVWESGAAALIWKVASLESRSRSREIPARSGGSVESAFFPCFWRNDAPVDVRTYAAHEILQNDALDAIVAAHREENESHEVWLKVYLKENFKRSMQPHVAACSSIRYLKFHALRAHRLRMTRTDTQAKREK